MKTSDTRRARQPLRISAWLLYLFFFGFLQACGSSGSGTSSDGLSEPFQAPVDAASLQSALVTDDSVSADSAHWQCALSDGSRQLEYRLLSGGTGVETDLANPTAPSAFTWQTISATTMSTTVDSTGMQIEFTDIQFESRDQMSLAVGENVRLNCARMSVEPSVPVVPAGNNSLSYGGTVFTLTHGFEEVFSFVQNSLRQDTHSQSEFSVADATFRLLFVPAIGPSPSFSLWRPTEGSIWFKASLFSPGEGGFESATFEYESDSVDVNGPLVQGRFFFNDARLAIDSDGNGSFDSENNEFIDVTGGTVSVDRVAGDIASMSFDVILEDGVSLSGSFEGQFVVFEN